ncbi:MAG TPA: hypothetical protein VIT88_05645 [Pyrinomonadaceae bacterium]
MYERVPFPDTVVLVGVTAEISPVLVAEITVLLALVIVTTANVLGLEFLGNVKVEGADNTHTGGVAELAGDGLEEGEGELPGDGLVSACGLGDGSVPGEGDGSDPADGDGDASGFSEGDGEGSVPSIGLAAGEPETSVEGLELSVISPISLSWKISFCPIVTSPEPER